MIVGAGVRNEIKAPAVLNFGHGGAPAWFGSPDLANVVQKPIICAESICSGGLSDCTTPLPPWNPGKRNCISLVCAAPYGKLTGAMYIGTLRSSNLNA